MILRLYQQSALDTLWRYLRHADGNPALVLPTGAGKSPLMAAIAREAVQNWQGRVCILAHVQELVQQNADKFARLAPEIPHGIYAAGLRRKDRFERVLFCQIQSVHNKAMTLGHFDLILVDEAHRIPLKSEGMYRGFISAVQKINPHARVVGLTATPYRLQGAAVPVCGPDNVLTEIAYEARVLDLIRDGYLSPLVSKAGERPDLAAVKIKGGEYDEAGLADAMLANGLVERTVADLLTRADGRRAGIVFCVNVAHAEAVLDALHERGEMAALVHGKTPKAERGRLIADFQSGDLRWMVNVNVLSEGFDAPHIDCVAMLRPTKSPGMYYQQVGRGFRLAPGKADCLVLDYAGNMLEHGPVDAIRVQPARGKKAAAVTTASAKECPACSSILATGYRTCPDCGHVFPQGDPGHLDRPVDAPVLSVRVEPVRHVVNSVRYERHTGKSGVPSLKVTYQCGLRRFSEYVCLQHSGMAGAKARTWWMDRSGTRTVPRTVEEAMASAYSLPRAVAVTVDENEKWPRIIAVELGAADEPVPGTTEGAPEWLAQAIGRAA